MKFTLEIELGNDAMKTGNDVRGAVIESFRALPHTLALTPIHTWTIRDINGNTVGKWVVFDETACAVCGVSAPQHGHYDATNPNTHLWKSPV